MSVDEAAEAALSKALQDGPGQDEPVDGRLVGDEVDTTAGGDRTPCTRDEAEHLVSRARTAINELHQVMTEIIERRAWEALGYTDPQRFWLTEFRHGEGSFSRAHLYRTARVLGFLYGLYERLGNDALAIDISERALRSVPKDADGDLLAAIEGRIEDLGAGPAADDVQAAVDDEISKARTRAAETDDTGSDGPAPSVSSGPAEVSDDDWDDTDPPAGANGAQEGSSRRAGGSDGVDGLGVGASLGPSEDAEFAHLEAGLQVGKLQRSVMHLVELADDLDDVVSRLSRTELEALATAAADAQAVLARLSAAADEDSDEIDMTTF